MMHLVDMHVGTRTHSQDSLGLYKCTGMLVWQASTTLTVWCTSIAGRCCKVDITMLHIQIYEQRALPDPVNKNLDRSYHLAMSHRGMGAFEKVCSSSRPLALLQHHAKHHAHLLTVMLA